MLNDGMLPGVNKTNKVKVYYDPLAEKITAGKGASVEVPSEGPGVLSANASDFPKFPRDLIIDYFREKPCDFLNGQSRITGASPKYEDILWKPVSFNLSCGAGGALKLEFGNDACDAYFNSRPALVSKYLKNEFSNGSNIELDRISSSKLAGKNLSITKLSDAVKTINESESRMYFLRSGEILDEIIGSNKKGSAIVVFNADIEDGKRSEIKWDGETNTAKIYLKAGFPIEGCNYYDDGGRNYYFNDIEFSLNEGELVLPAAYSVNNDDNGENENQKELNLNLLKSIVKKETAAELEGGDKLAIRLYWTPPQNLWYERFLEISGSSKNLAGKIEDAEAAVTAIGGFTRNYAGFSWKKDMAGLVEDYFSNTGAKTIIAGDEAFEVLKKEFISKNAGSLVNILLKKLRPFDNAEESDKFYSKIKTIAGVDKKLLNGVLFSKGKNSANSCGQALSGAGCEYENAGHHEWKHQSGKKKGKNAIAGSKKKNKRNFEENNYDYEGPGHDGDMAA